MKSNTAIKASCLLAAMSLGLTGRLLNNDWMTIAGGNDKLILDAQLAVEHPEFKGNVATVYTKPISQGGASNGHYGGNAKTYMDVGLGMGEAMVELLKKCL